MVAKNRLFLPIVCSLYLKLAGGVFRALTRFAMTGNGHFAPLDHPVNASAWPAAVIDRPMGAWLA